MRAQTSHITTTLTLHEMESLIRRVVKEAMHEEIAILLREKPEAPAVRERYRTNPNRSELIEVIEIEGDVEVVYMGISSEQREFHEALRSSGLVKEIKWPMAEVSQRRPLVEVSGQPVSATIIAERR